MGKAALGIEKAVHSDQGHLFLHILSWAKINKKLP